MCVWVILLTLYQAGWVELQCVVLHPLLNDACLKCEVNYYLKSSRYHACPTSCTECISDTDCSECKPFYYGLSCQYDCLGCSYGLCVNNSGICSSGCNIGYYSLTNNVCSKCQMACKECDDYYHCTECIEGTYLNQVSSGLIYCASCPSRRSGCSDNATCTQCRQSHYWGTYCQYNCNYCVSECDENNGCTAGCTDGYYKTYNVSKGGYQCNQCPASCVSCTDMSHCQECKDGFYGEANSVCTECSIRCRDAPHCNTSTGFCMNGCRDGWSGDMCNQSCPSGCIICEQDNLSSCGKCSEGLYGDKCERHCSPSCKIGDGKQVCNKRNGYCNHGCKNAFWGHACENPVELDAMALFVTGPPEYAWMGV